MRWIIGDIHGMLVPLRALIGAIRRADSGAEFFFVGDYVNRGPDSKGVVDLLLDLNHARFARGNHDDVFDLILNGQGLAPDLAGADRAFAFQWFMQHGLCETLTSYGASPQALSRLAARPNVDHLNKLLRCVPPSHRQFFRGLPPVIEFDDLFIAHAKWDPETPTEPALAGRLDSTPFLHRTVLWGRFVQDEVTRDKPWQRTGYFGHTPVDHYFDPGSDNQEMLPVVGNKLVLLDTAVALVPEGRLTGFCAETQTYLQVNRDGIQLKTK